jgi:selenobiotic family peptide radical SAM maturase
MLRDGRLFGRTAGSFSLQWHLTNACELACGHCYDRAVRGHLSLAQALAILDGLTAFCRAFAVSGQVCLTGGNPFLYPHFLPLYRAVAASVFSVSILGNPVQEEVLAEIVGQKPPLYFQVSLEGQEDYNDRIRGPGHFRRVLDFLPLLRKWQVRSQVMLTLHRDNLGQLVPLATELAGKVDRFTFNRLAQVGSGESLALPGKAEYVELLKDYVVASRTLPHLGFKDGLFNILRHHYRRPLMHGCTGYGCGAAFNFVAVLPDGEVHACRKFPSPIGHLQKSSLIEIYTSPQARRYRKGCRACRFCRLRNACGGCLAVTHGAGLAELEARDPHCFISERKRLLKNW